jgi:3-deoxy-manno-octulosonate cytidylyltransferase (CMP-KDO synthetase)
MTETLCIIPARMASSRFPGKPLKPLLGLPLILHVYERCRRSTHPMRAIVATCDEEIRAAVVAHGGEAVMTADTHPGCVDRTDEAVRLLAADAPDASLVLMVQGDEVLVTPDMIDAVIADYTTSKAPVVNLASRIARTEDHDDPNTVKVVADLSGNALFFSRAPIPSRARTMNVPMYQQTGVIGFAKSFVHKFGTLPRTPMEMAEGIDMLRVLEHGLKVRVVFTDRETIGVDTPADLTRAEGILRSDPVTRAYLKTNP